MMASLFDCFGCCQADEKTMANAKVFVDEAIGSKKVVVFSKDGCPYCGMTQELLKSYNLGDDLYWINIANLADCQAIQDYLRELTGARTVPRVFINGKSIGGNSDVQSLHGSGELRKMLG